MPSTWIWTSPSNASQDASETDAAVAEQEVEDEAMEVDPVQGGAVTQPPVPTEPGSTDCPVVRRDSDSNSDQDVDQ